MKAIPCLVFVLGAASAFAQNVTPPKTFLKVGDTAPDFTVTGRTSTGGQDMKLSAFRGQKNVILAFFPAAFTGGCTKEITAYTAGIGRFSGMDTQVVAISTDFVATLSHWSKELGAEFPLVSDHDHKLSQLYGVLIPEMGLANRTTFVVDMEGKIALIEEGSSAIDPSGAETVCSRLSHKK